jgi:hypothetical protein
LHLEVSSSAAWSLRDAFLGTCEQERGAHDTTGQVVGELGTMICGRFLSSVDPLSTMSLATPEAGQQVATANKASKHVRQEFVLESGHLTASVEFDNEKE